MTSKYEPRGYAANFARRVLRSTGTSLGVQLGKACVQYGVPIAWVANELQVSRQTVYRWFTGEAVPNGARSAELEALIKQLHERYA